MLRNHQLIQKATPSRRTAHPTITHEGVIMSEQEEAFERTLREWIRKLRLLTPVAPIAITWETGNDILNFVQDEFLPAVEKLYRARDDFKPL
jgi:hypothetical protein